MNPTLSPKKRELVRVASAALATVRPQPWPTRAFRALPRGPGGRNAVLAATSEAQRFVVKIRLDPSETIDREVWALKLTSGSVGPTLIGSTSAAVPSRSGNATVSGLGGCLILEHLQGPRPRPSWVNVDRAAETIAELHSIRPRRGPELPCPSSPEALFQYATDLARTVARSRLVGRSLLREIHACLARLTSKLAVRSKGASSARRSLCHGDLRWHNMILTSNKLMLVDFEHAGLGDPAVDWALMTCRTPLSEDQEARMLTKYLALRRDKGFMTRYELVLPFVGLMSALSAVIAGVHPKKAQTELRRALDRVLR